MLHQAYDVTFGIFDYIKQAMKETGNPDPSLKRPMSSVALHPAEDYTGIHSELGRLTQAYADLKVGTLFNLSWTEFMDLPVEYVDMLLRVARTSADRESGIQARVLADMQAGQNKK